MHVSEQLSLILVFVFEGESLGNLKRGKYLTVSKFRFPNVCPTKL